MTVLEAVTGKCSAGAHRFATYTSTNCDCGLASFVGHLWVMMCVRIERPDRLEAARKAGPIYIDLVGRVFKEKAKSGEVPKG